MALYKIGFLAAFVCLVQCGPDVLPSFNVDSWKTKYIAEGTTTVKDANNKIVQFMTNKLTVSGTQDSGTGNSGDSDSGLLNEFVKEKMSKGKKYPAEPGVNIMVENVQLPLSWNETMKSLTYTGPKFSGLFVKLEKNVYQKKKEHHKYSYDLKPLDSFFK